MHFFLQLELSLRDALEKGEIKFSMSKAVYLGMNENEDGDKVLLKGVKVIKVTELKNWGSTLQSKAEHGREVKKHLR